MTEAKKLSRDNRVIKSIFKVSGFKELESNNIHFSVDGGDTSEFDNIFVYKNLVVICECTHKKSQLSEHFSKKQKFAADFLNNKEKYISAYRESNKCFDDYMNEGGFQVHSLCLRFVYYSSETNLNVSETFPYVILRKDIAIYFKELCGTIEKSARYELLKFLGVRLGEIGDQRLKGRANNCTEDTFDAFILSGMHTNYPDDFLVVSFYSDPGSLIERAYVFRKHGWDEPDVSYQRMLKKEKLKAMRECLSQDAKVYVNNIIITLPDNLKIFDHNRQMDIGEIKEKGFVQAKISLPKELSTVGIVDGQHRIYSYYEGDDDLENKISLARTRQNLLVTGIVFPNGFSQNKKSRFEAELFLKINNTQTPVPQELRQEIETIVSPLSELAIAKSIITELNNSGPLKKLLASVVIDKEKDIPTPSIVKYTLLPMTNPYAKRSSELYKLWQSQSEENILNEDKLKEYIDFCKMNIINLLVGFQRNLGKEKWQVKTKINEGVLNQTTVGGLFVLFRDLLKYKTIYLNDQNVVVHPDYDNCLNGIAAEEFSGYTSSQWAKLGHKLYGKYFSGR